VSFGKGSNQTVSTQTPNPAAMSSYYNLLNQAGRVAQTPYDPYGGELVAGVNAQQMQGIGNINANAGFAQPYIAQAGQYAQEAAAPISAAQIQQYESPYTQDVVNATQAQFANTNAQQQSQVQGNAAAQGALGGDRTAVAAALTAGQQQAQEAPVIAGLENQGYQTGLSTALQEQQNLGQAAYSMGNLGVAGQNAALTGANAQVGAGSLEQQTQQAQDTALMNAFYQQEFAPEAMTSWEAGIDTGVGSNMGGTSTTAAPPPNQMANYLGLGILGLGVLSDRRLKEHIHKIGRTNDGQPIYRYRYKGDPRWQLGLIAQNVEKSHPDAVGRFAGFKTVDLKRATDDAVRRWSGGKVAGFARPHYDSGGGIGSISQYFADPWIPQVQITHGKGAPNPPSAPQQQQSPFANPQNIANALKGLTGNNNNGNGNSGGNGGFGNTPLGQGLQSAGDVVQDALQDAADDIMGERYGGAVRRKGGGVQRCRRGAPIAGLDLSGGVRGYADGGSPADWGPIDPGAFSPDLPDDLTGGYDEPTAPDVPLPRPAPIFAELGDTGAGNGGLSAADFHGAGYPVASGDDVPLPRSRPTLADADTSDLTGGGSPIASGVAIRPGSGGAPSLPAASKQAGFGGLGLLPFSDAASTGLMAAGLGMMASRSPFLANAVGEGGLAGMSAYAGTKKEEATVEEARKKLEQHADETRKKLEIETAREARMKEQDEATQVYRNKMLEQGKVPPGFRMINGNLEAIPNGPADPAHIQAIEQAKAAGKGAASSGLTPEGKEIMARQMISGNFTGYNSLGRTAQGMAVRNELNNMAAEIVMKEHGFTPTQAAQYMNDQKQEYGAHQIGLNTEARTVGQRETNLNLILRAADAAVPAALELNDKLARLGPITPLNRLIQHGEIMTSNEDLAKFAVANLQLAEHWARAMNPTGVMRDADRDLALKHLDTALSSGTYKAVVMQIQEQIKRERDSMRGVDPRTPLNANAPAPPAGGGGGGFTGRTATGPGGQKLRETSSGQWVQ
jgi:hypothetical protein